MERDIINVERIEMGREGERDIIDVEGDEMEREMERERQY